MILDQLKNPNLTTQSQEWNFISDQVMGGVSSGKFKVENIKILPGTYEVVISKKLLSRFVNKNYNLTYYIALEPDSTFE